MTLDDIKLHLQLSLTADKVDFPDMDEHVHRAVVMGLEEFWGAYSWNFKATEIPFTIDGSTNDYDLPDNFESIKSVREETSASGGHLRFYLKEDFDNMVPKISSTSTGTPAIYTIYRNADAGWKIKLYPNVGASTVIYLDYFVSTPSDATAVPEKFVHGVLAFAAKHAYPFGHIGKLNAQRAAAVELKALIKKDRIDNSRMTVMLTETDDPVREKYVFEI